VEIPGIEKSQIYAGLELVDYAQNAITSKVIFERITGNISIFAFDAGQTRLGKYSPFDTLVQVIEGRAEIVIDGIVNFVETGQFIIIPSNSINRMNATERFKLLSILIKSGYEEEV
jgi:quercetin dioxygenase-like cupin family protein